MTNYRTDIFTPTGTQLPSAVPIEGNYVLTERGVGTLHLVLPPSYPVDYLQKDGLIRVNRDIGAGYYLDGDATWLIRHRRQSLSGRERLTEVWAEHVNTLLARRVVAYAAGSAETSKTDYADDMIKAVVRENFTAPTDTARTMSGLSVEGDLSQAPSISRSFSRRNVLATLQDICDDAASQGTYLAFEVRTIGTSLTLVTYINQRGVDRRYGTGNYLKVSPSSGAIVESSLDEDWTDEVTYVYALGEGLQSARATGSAQNTVAEGSGPYGRIEDTYQMNSASNSAILDDAAAGQLYARRGIVRYEATGQDTKNFMYGRDYRWGDLLTISDFGAQFDVRVDPVAISWGRGGEKVSPHFIYDNTGLAV